MSSTSSGGAGVDDAGASAVTAPSGSGATPGVAIAIVAAGLVAGSLPMFLIAALAPRIDAELGIGTRGTGVVVAAFFLAAAIGSIPGGRTADRLGSRRALQLGLAISVLGTGLAATLAQGLVSLVLTIGFAGFALSLIDPGGARTLAAAVTADRHGMAFGVKEASIPMASLLAGASLPLIPAEFGWRPSFIGAAVLAVVVGLAVPKHLERRAADETVAAADSHHRMASGPAGSPSAGSPSAGSPAAGSPSAGSPAAGSPSAGSPSAGSPSAGSPSAGSPRSSDLHDVPSPSAASSSADVPDDATDDVHPSERVAAAEPARRSNAAAVADPAELALVEDPRARRLSLLVLSLVAGLGGGIAAGFSTYLVTSAVAGGFSAEAAGVVFAASSLVAVVVRLVVGRVADAGQPGRELRLLRGAMVLGSVGIAISAVGTQLSSVLGGLLGLGAGWGWTGLVFLAAVRVDPERPAAASGIVLAGLAVGGVIGPALFGFVAEVSGFSLVFGLAAVVMALAGMIVTVPIRQIRPPGTTTG